jgi:ATP phosphoribosyltransferase regulatory subunit HisZ
MEATGYSTHASRSPAEITARLMDKQALASTRLSPEALDALKMFLALDVPLDRAAGTLSEFAKSAGLDIRSAQASFEARLDALSERGEDLSFDPLARGLWPSFGLLHRSGFRDRGRARPVWFLPVAAATTG